VSRRRAIVVAAVALATTLLHLVLVRAMAHGHVAHVLLGSGNAAPPVGAALLAVSLVLARFAAIVIAPGALLAAAASLVAHAVMGPPGSRRESRQRQRVEESEKAAPPTPREHQRDASDLSVHEPDAGSALAFVGSPVAMAHVRYA
jgi:hypothetical protein